MRQKTSATYPQSSQSSPILLLHAKFGVSIASPGPRRSTCGTPTWPWPPWRGWITHFSSKYKCLIICSLGVSQNYCLQAGESQAKTLSELTRLRFLEFHIQYSNGQIENFSKNASLSQSGSGLLKVTTNGRCSQVCNVSSFYLI